MARAVLFVAVLGLAACTQGVNLRPLVDPGEAQRRGAVELAVKSAYPAILAEIEAGAGPSLARAFDAAGVPPQDRPTRVIQLRGDRGLYDANPGALVTALLVYGR